VPLASWLRPNRKRKSELGSVNQLELSSLADLVYTQLANVIRRPRRLFAFVYWFLFYGQADITANKANV
jgi:hypothetical protein